MKGKEEASERMLNEIQASQLSDTEFKAMVFRKLTELSGLGLSFMLASCMSLGLIVVGSFFDGSFPKAC